MRFEKGFTIIEVTIVLTIISILTIVTIPSVITWTGKQSLKNYSLQAVDYLRRAEVRSTSGDGDQDHGVHFETNKFVLFEGSTYLVSDPDNEVVNLPSNVTISSISLTGGGSEVVFDKNTGETSEDGSVTFLYSDGTTKVVDINELGLVQIL